MTVMSQNWRQDLGIWETIIIVELRIKSFRVKLSPLWNFGHDWTFSLLYCNIPNCCNVFELYQIVKSKAKTRQKTYLIICKNMNEVWWQKFLGRKNHLPTQNKLDQCCTLFSKARVWHSLLKMSNAAHPLVPLPFRSGHNHLTAGASCRD